MPCTSSEGDKVRAGQLLVELESRDLAGAAAESRAAADLADANYETASRGTVPEEVQKAELDARAAKDALDAQQAVLDSRQALFKEGAIAQKDVNDAQVALSQARTQYETTRKHLEDLQGFGRDQALKVAAAERDAAHARDTASEAQLCVHAARQPDRRRRHRSAVLSGRVRSSRSAGRHRHGPVAGHRAGACLTGRCRAARVGNDASLIGPDRVPIPGKVTQISPALDPGSTTVEVWVQADNADGKLRAGASIRVELIAKTVADALIIPQTAVLTTPTGATYAIVIDNESKPHLRKVAVGVKDSGNAQVTDGLENGQRVATTGSFELFKLDPEVLEKTTVKIAPPREEEEEPEET